MIITFRSSRATARVNNYRRPAIVATAPAASSERFAFVQVRHGQPGSMAPQPLQPGHRVRLVRIHFGCKTPATETIVQKPIRC